ncbi:hypothetical protein TWF506_006420 [Arthrobotrys conoides]|uniref:Uncharacterized protein n=1 Tax=Arthrobotrys conoides TaxID=74498 RepID=A0AAN8RNZ6_9PEZI
MSHLPVYDPILTGPILQIPPHSFDSGNHTGLGYCLCPKCGPGGAIILYEVRISHIESKRRKQQEKGEVPPYIGVPVAPFEMQIEFERIRAYLLRELSDQLFEKLQIEYYTKLEDLTNALYAANPDDGSAQIAQKAVDDHRDYGNRVGDTANQRAAEVIFAYMDIYYPDYRENSLSDKDIYGGGPELLKAVFKRRIFYKNLEITALWRRIEKLQERSEALIGLEARERNRIAAEAQGAALPGAVYRTPNWQDLNNLTLAEEPNCFPGVLKGMGYTVWLTRRALGLDAGFLSNYSRRRLDATALGFFMKFYITNIGQRIDFMDSLGVSGIRMPESRVWYTVFLLTEWDSQVHHGLKYIAATKLQALIASGEIGTPQQAVASGLGT